MRYSVVLFVVDVAVVFFEPSSRVRFQSNASVNILPRWSKKHVDRSWEVNCTGGMGTAESSSTDVFSFPSIVTVLFSLLTLSGAGCGASTPLKV